MNVLEMEQVNNSENCKERYEALSPPMAPFSNGKTSSAWNAFIHVLDELVENGEASNERTVGRLFTAFRQLCPLAFCAYSNPTKEPGWTECTNDGCRVKYLDWYWLDRATKGVLKITLKDAQNVPKSDLLSESDSYIVFSTQASRVASEIKQNDPNPHWNSTLFLLIKNDLVLEGAEPKLHLELYDSDGKKYQPQERAARQILRKDDFLGSAFINLNELLTCETKEWAIPLKLKKNKQSSQDTVVRFSTEFISLHQALIEQPEKLKPFDFSTQQEPNPKERLRWELWNMNDESDENHGFRPVAFVNGATTGTQAWIFVCERIKTVAVVFRGTEKTRCKDFRTVIQFKSSRLLLKKIEGCNLELTTAAQDEKIRVHRGFRGAYKSIRKTVWQLVFEITGWSKDWKICTTGHSLGGALAALCAFDYANTRDENANGPKVFMMNFGSPRIGNKRFQEIYDKSVEHSCRVAIGQDIVCGLPPCFNHVGSELRFQKPGEVLWRGESVKEIQVDVPDKSKENSDLVRTRWQRIGKSVKIANICKSLVEKWSGKRATGDLLRLRRVFGCATNGRRVRKDLIVSRKPRTACRVMRMVATAVSLKEIINKEDETQQETSSMPNRVHSHTETSYQQFARMYTHGGAKSRDLFAWSAHMRASVEFRRVFDSARELLNRNHNVLSSPCIKRKDSEE